jgi:hypothetical protein
MERSRAVRRHTGQSRGRGDGRGDKITVHIAIPPSKTAFLLWGLITRYYIVRGLSTLFQLEGVLHSEPDT